MRYTVNNCAARSVEERVDQYDELLGKDQAVLEARKRIAGMLECLRQSLVRFHVPPDLLQILNDLEDGITELESEDVLAIARADLDGAALAVKLGLMIEAGKPYDPHCPEEGRRDIK